MTLGPVAGSFAGLAQSAPGAKARHQLPFERTSAFDVERLVDRLVTDAHVRIIGEVNDEAS